MELLLILLLLKQTKISSAEETCPKPLLSGIEYSKTQTTLAAAQKWLNNNKEALESLSFLPTLKPQKPKGRETGFL